MVSSIKIVLDVGRHGVQSATGIAEVSQGKKHCSVPWTAEVFGQDAVDIKFWSPKGKTKLVDQHHPAIRHEIRQALAGA